MRKRKSVHIIRVRLSRRAKVLLSLCLPFLLGAAAGGLLVYWQGDNGALSDYLGGYASALGEGAVTTGSLLSLCWYYLRWTLLVALLGLTALGVVGIPLVFALRGFLLSFAAASILSAFGGWQGVLVTAAIFGVPGLISVPVLFLLGVQGMGMAAAMAFPGGTPRLRRYLGECALCCGVTLLCGVLDMTVTTRLLYWIIL